MEIRQNGWVFDAKCTNLKDDDYQNSLDRTLRCETCNGRVSRWYASILKSLAEFLPKNHKTICCGCATRKALKLENCPLCDNYTNVRWTEGNVRIACNSYPCSWGVSFPKIDVELSINKYFTQLLRSL